MNTIADARPKENLLDVILNTVSDGVTVIDKDLRILYHNKIISQVFGSQIGNYCFKAYRGSDTPCRDCIVLDVLKDGKERRAIVNLPLRKDDVRLMEISSAPIRDADGNITGAVEVARDVTDQKKAEALLNNALLEQSEDLQRLNNEISDAAGYVKTVLPQKIVSDRLHTDWRFIPSAALGGDSFGYHWIDNDHFAVYLLDVSGHGWGAALFSVSVINVLRSHALPMTDFRDPKQVLFSLNNAFQAEQHNDMFLTIWYGVYNKTNEHLVYSSGGHPPALWIADASPGNAKAVRLGTHDFIVGGKPDVIYRNNKLPISRPSRMIVFSDGVYDVVKAGGSFWGFDRFLKFTENYAPGNESYLDSLLQHVQELSQKDTYEDDFTILEIVFK